MQHIYYVGPHYSNSASNHQKTWSLKIILECTDVVLAKDLQKLSKKNYSDLYELKEVKSMRIVFLCTLG